MLIYGRKIIPHLKLLTATYKTTIRASTIFASFIGVPLVWPSLIGGNCSPELSCLISLCHASFDHTSGKPTYQKLRAFGVGQR